MSSDAMCRGAQHGMNAMEAVHGGAAGTGVSFVAGIIYVPEVVATVALQQIPAGGSHIAQLRRSAGKERLGQHGVEALHLCVVRQIAVAYHCADFQSAALWFNAIEW